MPVSDGGYICVRGKPFESIYPACKQTPNATRTCITFAACLRRFLSERGLYGSGSRCSLVLVIIATVTMCAKPLPFPFQPVLARLVVTCATDGGRRGVTRAREQRLAAGSQVVRLTFPTAAFGDLPLLGDLLFFGLINGGASAAHALGCGCGERNAQGCDTDNGHSSRAGASPTCGIALERLDLLERRQRYR